MPSSAAADSTAPLRPEAPIRIVIVDDEPVARQLVRSRIEPHRDFVIVGEAEDGPSAVGMIRRLKPEVLLLDVQMPGMNGLEVLDAVADEVLPQVVFITAFDEYALRAFDYHAVDYLVKPYEQAQLDRALDRIRALRGVLTPSEAVASLLSHAGSPGDATSTREPLSRIAVRQGDRFILIKTADIEWIEADGNYVKLHANQRVYPLRQAIGAIERRLNPSQFARIHRGTIVNLDRISEIFPDSHGDCLLVLSDRTQLRVSRSYRARLIP